MIQDWEQAVIVDERMPKGTLAVASPGIAIEVVNKSTGKVALYWQQEPQIVISKVSE